MVEQRYEFYIQEIKPKFYKQVLQVSENCIFS